MQNRRHSHTCSPVGRDSCVLVAGGKFGSTFLRGAEIYAPAQQCWTRIAELPVAAASQASLRATPVSKPDRESTRACNCAGASDAPFLTHRSRFFLARRNRSTDPSTHKA